MTAEALSPLEATIMQGFCLLEAAGFRQPETYKSPQGLQQGIAVYAKVLAELTPREVEAAFESWLRDTGPWWPSTGQLLQGIPHRDESRLAWSGLERGRGDHIAHLVQKHGDIDPKDQVGFERAYRAYTRNWLALEPEDRSAFGALTSARERVAMLESSGVLVLEGFDSYRALIGGGGS